MLDLHILYMYTAIRVCTHVWVCMHIPYIYGYVHMHTHYLVDAYVWATTQVVFVQDHLVGPLELSMMLNIRNDDMILSLV